MSENLIPGFISKKYKEKKLKGTINAVTMYVDVVGFTSITENLIEHGKEGAEILSEVIYQIFEPPIDSIYINNGWVANFEGDAFMAIFDEKDTRMALSAAMEIQKFFEKVTIKTEYGNFNINARIGLSSGTVDWGIVEEEETAVYYIRGEAVNGCAQSEKMCNPGEIIVDKEINEKIGENLILNERGKYFLVRGIKYENPDDLTLKVSNIEKNILKNFLPEAVLSLRELGEFRNISSLFISFEAGEDIDKFLKTVIKITRKYGGYLNKVNFGDKGGVILILIGAPVSTENQETRAINLIMELFNTVDKKIKLRAGLTEGRVYTGLIGSGTRSEYTALGKIVNLSARFMMKAGWGEIYTDKKTFENTKSNFKMKYLGRMLFKGFKEKIPVYSIISKTEIQERIFSGKIFGREAELNSLDNYLEPIREGVNGGIVYIDGKAGVGKSRLMKSFKEKLDKESYNWFYLPCDEIVRESFNPLRHFAANYFRYDKEEAERINIINFEKCLKNIIQKTEDEEIKKELERTKSIMGSILNLTWRGSLYEQLKPKEKYDNLIYAYKNLIKAEATNKPTIIELEDTQWVDKDTVEFFKVLLRNVENYPFIILAGARLRDDNTPFRLPLKEVKVKNISLGNLSKKSIKALIENRLSGKISRELLDLICEKSEGNPFYVEQILLYLKENDIIYFKDDLFRVKEKHFDIPAKINSIILARIDRLEKKLKQLVKTASVLGKEFSVKILSSMLKGKSIKKELSEGEDKAIWRGISEILYIFTHALIRDTVYEMQLKKTLRNLHKLAAETIEDIYSEELEAHYDQLAHHYVQSEIKSKAREYLKKAADYSRNEYKNKRALEFYNRLLNYLTARKEKIKIKMNIGKIHEHIGEWDKAEEIFEENNKLAEETGSEELIARQKILMGELYRRKGNYEKALELLEESEELLDEKKNRGELATVFRETGNIYRNKGNHYRAESYYKKQMTLADEISDREKLSNAFGNLGILYQNHGDYDRAMKYLKKQYDIARADRDKANLSKSLGQIGLIYFDRGNYQKAMEYHRRKLATEKEIGDKSGISHTIGNMGIIYYRMGEYEKAMKCYEKDLEIEEELGDKKGKSIAIGNIGIVYRREGNYQKAIECYRKQYEIASKIGFKGGENIAAGNLGILYLNMGEYDKAMEYFIKNLNISENLKYREGTCFAHSNIGTVFHKKQEYGKALKHFSKAIKISEEMGTKFLTSENFYNKAKLLFDLDRIKEARKANKKAIKIAGECQNTDILFKAGMLESKIISLEDKEKGILKLREMLRDKSKERNPEQKKVAYLHYELHKLVEAKEAERHKKKALKIYRELYEKTPNIEYREIIEEIE